ncbi:MAG: CtkA family protein [Ruminococcaceae bacterium]|nr:CtkA family protein [Oscillospiraceae bacterium]
MIDFTNLPRKNKTYAGANGSKLSVIYENEQYMLKFPAFAPKNKDLSYANGCVSEYLGCQIFNCIGVEAQKTLLGTFNKNGKEKIVVACKDFTSPGIVLQDFASLKNTIIDSVHNGYGTELSDILQAIDEQAAVDPVMLKEHFWNMFIIDALIGNWDRHNGNWGFLYNTATDEMTLAPVYDCGSCLYPQADEKMMKAVLEKQEERDFRVYEAPLSNIKLNSRKIKYYDFIYSLQDNDCNKALKRIVPKIDMQKIYAIVDNTPYITELQKKFYKTMLKERKEKILDKSLAKLKQREKSYER